MVVKTAIVETHQFHLHQVLNFFARRVDHPYNCVVAFELPTDNEQIWIDLDVEYNHSWIGYFDRYVRIAFKIRFGLEFHLLNRFQACSRLIRTVVRERQYPCSHVRYVILQSILVCFFENMSYEIDGWLRAWMNLLPEIPLD